MSFQRVDQEPGGFNREGYRAIVSMIGLVSPNHRKTKMKSYPFEGIRVPKDLAMAKPPILLRQTHHGHIIEDRAAHSQTPMAGVELGSPQQQNMPQLQYTLSHYLWKKYCSPW